MHLTNRLSVATAKFFTVTIPANYSNSFLVTKGCGFICGIAAAESAILAAGNALTIFNNKGKDNTKTINNLSFNLATFLLLGMCSTNILPVSPYLGAGLIIGYSRFTQDKNYLSTEIINTTLDTIETVINKVLDVVIPIFIAIFSASLAFIKMIPLPPNPIWGGVGVMAAAILIYKCAQIVLQK